MSAPRPQASRTIGSFLAFASVLVGSFLPWGSITGRTEGANPLGALLGEGLGMRRWNEVTMHLDGWNGTLTALQVEWPNALVPCVGMLLALLLLIDANPSWRAPRPVCVVLALYGLAHVAWVAVVLVQGEGTLGVGLLLSGAAFVGMLVAAVRGAGAAPREP